MSRLSKKFMVTFNKLNKDGPTEEWVQAYEAERLKKHANRLVPSALYSWCYAEVHKYEFPENQVSWAVDELHAIILHRRDEEAYLASQK